MKPDLVVEQLTDYLEQKLEETGLNGYVVGVSGGIDSAVTLKLAVEAVSSENVHAWLMPGNPSSDDNLQDARELVSDLGVESTEVNVEPVLDSIKEQVDLDAGKTGKGNIRARTRMIFEYMDANHSDMLVLGTGNRTEWLLGYFTKYGDGAADLSVLLDLYKTEVREVAREIGLDQKFIEKEPTAGLWEGQTDEDELGNTYEIIDQILRKVIDEGKSIENASEELEFEESEIRRIIDIHEKTAHKRKGIDYPEL